MTVVHKYRFQECKQIYFIFIFSENENIKMKAFILKGDLRLCKGVAFTMAKRKEDMLWRDEDGGR